jgi:2'-5' RNA ligase
MGLQLLVEEQMVRLGFAQGDRSFTPHLTLGRIKSIRSRESWVHALEEISGLTLPEFDVTAISVMKSELKPAGAVYTERGRVELA